MNVLFLSEPSYPRHPGGAGKSTHLLAAGMAARGHTARILCESREATEREVIDGVEVHRLSWAELAPVPRQHREAAIAEKILAYLEREIPLASLDLVYDSGGFLSFFFPVAYQLRLRHRLPSVIHYRYLLVRHHMAMTGDDFDPFAPWALRMEASINEPSQNFPARFAEAVVCPSRFDARFVQAHFRPASGEPAVIPEPLELDLHDPGAAAALRAQLLQPGQQLVFFGGRIDSNLKGGDVVIRAFARMRAARPGVRLLLSIKEHEQGTLVPFRQRFGDAVIARPWVREARELATVLGAVDVVLMPSLYESYGMMCAEALAAGAPVVGSRVGALPDLIRHGENGFLLQGEDRRGWDAELAALALRILEDPERARRMSAAARESAQPYGVGQVAERTEALCQAVLRRSRERGLTEVKPPSFSEVDRARYLDLLEARVGPRGRAAGEKALATWGTTAAAAERCVSCSRQSLSGGALDLVQLGRWWGARRLWSKATGSWPRAVEAAVAGTCPWGLLQRASLVPKTLREPAP